MALSLHVLLLTLLNFWAYGVLAQLAGTPPQCALPCIVSTKYQGCATADSRCLCTNPTAVTGVQACIQSNCTVSDRSAAMAFVQQECLSLTSSPSDTTAAITKTASSASEATDASSGNSASPRSTPGGSIISLLVFMTFLVVLVPTITVGSGFGTVL